MIKMRLLTAFVLISLSAVSVTSGLRCLRCNEVFSPILCNYITTCGPGEICGIEKVRNENGNVLYNLGCKSTQTCTDFGNRKTLSKTSRSGQTSSTYTTLCHECCQNDICNAAGCGQLGYPFDVGAVCMDCENVNDPRNCDKIKACDDDEVCYIDEKILFHMRLFTSKCVQRHVCDPTDPDIFGRKKRDQFSVVKRSTNYCRKCCNSNLCNDNCGKNGGYSSYSPYYTTKFSYYRTSTYPTYWISTYPPYTTTSSPAFNITFTTCGRISGPTGPTLSGCRTWYGNVWPRNGSLFNVVSGVQKWEVPETGYYTFDAYGAAGGYGNNNITHNLTGGLGARIKGTFYLNAHSVLYIVVGQKGQNGGNSESGGGGGGTFVYTGNIGGSGLLIAAGGGGGSGEEDTHRGYDGYSGLLSLSSIGVVGNSGRGGRGGNVTSAGAGWLGSGGSNFGSDRGNPGSRWNGGISPATPTGAGGFGGGGSGVYTNGGGGGGGYTGGEGMSVSNRTLWGGSGGGSYNNGSNQINTPGYNDGPGFVIVTKN